MNNYTNINTVIYTDRRHTVTYIHMSCNPPAAASAAGVGVEAGAPPSAEASDVGTGVENASDSQHTHTHTQMTEREVERTGKRNTSQR